MRKYFCLLFLSIFFFSSITLSYSSPNTLNNWAHDMIHLDSAHESSNGTSVIIALLDTGISTNVFSDIIWENPNELPNGIDDDDNGYIDDINGWNFIDNSNNTNDWSPSSHGTSVTSIINEAAPESKVIPLVVIDSNDLISDTYYQSIANALIYAKDMGANIVYMPFRISQIPYYLSNTLNILYNSGVVLVSSAGQAPNGPLPYIFHPASHDKTIAVGAVSSSKVIYSIGNFGNEMEITAPGVDLSVVDKYGNPITSSGTSLSGAYVTGVIALFIDKRNSISPTEIRNLLYSTSIDINTSKWDVFSGAGILNASKSVQYALDDSIPTISYNGFEITDDLNIHLSFGISDLTGIFKCKIFFETKAGERIFRDPCYNLFSPIELNLKTTSLTIPIEYQTSTLNYTLTIQDYLGNQNNYSDFFKTGLTDQISGTVSSSTPTSSNLPTNFSTITDTGDNFISYRTIFTDLSESTTNANSINYYFNFVFFVLPILFIILKRKLAANRKSK